MDRGIFGEQAAERFLRRKGYGLLARRWRCFGGEIDLIMLDRRVLVFVEVKTRDEKNPAGGYGAACVFRKKKSLRHACFQYLQQLENPPQTFRYDVVEIKMPARWCRADAIYHFENVPLFEKDERF